MKATLDWFTISLMSSRKQDCFVFLFHHKFYLLFSRLLCHSKITAETSAFTVITDREKKIAKEFYLKCVGHMCVQGGCKGSFSVQHLASILIIRKGQENGEQADNQNSSPHLSSKEKLIIMKRPLIQNRTWELKNNACYWNHLVWHIDLLIKHLIRG